MVSDEIKHLYWDGKQTLTKAANKLNSFNISSKVDFKSTVGWLYGMSIRIDVNLI